MPTGGPDTTSPGLEDPTSGNYLKSFEEFGAMINMMDSVRGGERLRSGHVGVRIGTEPFRYAHGADAAAVLHRWLPRLDGGPLLRGVVLHPFHFINQSELSPNPSPAQRDLPYPGFDMEAGIRHLQLMGVKYYLAASPQAVQARAVERGPDRTGLDRSVFGARRRRS